ncbi:ATP-grasp domain-containing protein [Amycolatopsis bartoniae]|nr:ATP-grasp domain-containing protein [Amycolatopsis bartoniae]
MVVSGVGRRPAFILFGDLHKIGPYLADLDRRGLAVLLVSGRGGTSLARRAREMLGKPGHPLGAVADVLLTDGGDSAGIADRAAQWAERYRVVGALAVAEVFVEPAALVCDLLALPGVGPRASVVCRNKALQRRYLEHWSPLSVLVQRGGAGTDEIGRDRYREVPARFTDRFPTVVKPLTLESSMGVRVARDEEELFALLAGLGPRSEILVEERVSGREYNVDTIVVDGELLTTMITQKGTNERSTNYFVEVAHTTPPTNLDPGEKRRIERTHGSVVKRLRFGTGMAHAEYRLTDDGRVVLMEIAARPPGDACLPLYELATGQPVEPALIDAALGGATTYPGCPARRARQLYFEHTPGRLAEVRVDWPEPVRPRWLADTTGIWPEFRPTGARDPLRLHEVLVLKRRGEQLGAITDSSGRAVTAVFDAPLDADIDVAEMRVRDAVTVVTRDDALETSGGRIGGADA